MKKIVAIIFLLSFLVISSAGCSSKTDPAQTVVQYLDALENQDADAAVALACADWEEQARLQVDSFLSVGVTLNNVQCQTSSQGDEEALVNCTGSIDMTYDEEVRSIDLSTRTYTLGYQSGEWLICNFE